MVRVANFAAEFASTLQGTAKMPPAPADPPRESVDEVALPSVPTELGSRGAEASPIAELRVKKKNDRVVIETPTLADSVSSKKRSAPSFSTPKPSVKKPKPNVPGFSDNVQFSYKKDTPLVNDRMSCADLVSQVKISTRPISDFTKLRCSDQYQEFAQSIFRMMGFANSMVCGYEEKVASAEKSSVEKSSEEFEGMARSLNDLKANFAVLAGERDLLKDRCFSLEKSAEEIAQALAAKDRELKALAAAKDLAIVERDQMEVECARLRKSRTEHVAQVVAKGQRRLDVVKKYLEEQARADPILSKYNQAEGISEMIKILVEGGHVVVGDGILEELEKGRIAAKKAADVFDIRAPRTPDLTMTPDPLAVSFAPLPKSDDAPSVVPEGIDQHGTNVKVIGEMSASKGSVSEEAS